jgi:hypothetical protein
VAEAAPTALSAGRTPRRWFAAAILSALLIPLLLGPATAQADDRHRWIRNMVGDDFCLDSNAAGNNYQKWQHWNGGWARNVATGRCLENPTFTPYAIRTSPCSLVNMQYWQHWQRGWFQRPAWAGQPTAGCLTVDGRRVYVSLCGDPFNPFDSVRWYTELA